MDLQELQYEASVCKQCNLYKNRNKPVFAKGSPESKIIICGMCPGPSENAVGLPFVGQSGKILDKLISETIQGFPYITNLVKCYVPPGTVLTNKWMSRCLPYFIAQLKFIKPKVIVTLGGDVSNFLVNRNTFIGNLRGKQFKYLGIPVVCTYHPSYYVRGGGELHKHFEKGLDDFNFVNKI